MASRAHWTELPLVGRTSELAALRAALDEVARGNAGMWVVSGDSGVGKTRLGTALLEEARQRGWATARGRAFPVEAGVPYALLADALLPTVRRFDKDERARLARGVGELTHVFPWLAGDDPPSNTNESAAAAGGFRTSADQGRGRSAAEGPAGADFVSRLHWHFTQFLRDLVAGTPLVVVLEDLQWADTSSLELLHFVARQLTDEPIFIYCTYNPRFRDANAAFRMFEQSLVGLRLAESRRLGPLTLPAVAEIVNRLFDAEPSVTQDFVAMVYGWTQGNAFFLAEMLKHVVEAGDLRLVDGRWTGWEVDTMRLPPSVRDAVLGRVSALSADAREVADVAAVLGERFMFGTLGAVLGSAGPALPEAVEELRRAGILEEREEPDDVVYDFAHPLIRETLYGELGRLRTRLLHGAVAEALERRYAATALDHADELAYHFSRTQAEETEEKAVTYLLAAGAQALSKYANREAADYLAAALKRMERGGYEAGSVLRAMVDLARALQRLGEYGEASRLCERAQQGFLANGDPVRAARVARSMGLACFWTGQHGDAIGHFEAGLEWAAKGGDTALEVRLWTAYATCLQEIGRSDDALRAAQCALAKAGGAAPAALLAGIHRTFLQLHLWKGDAELARMHAGRALELAARSGDLTSAFMAHWATCLLEGFSGNAREVERHIEACARLAAELRSPVLRVWVAELKIEYASARGDWEVGLAMGHDAIHMARALQQRTLLPRLLVWTALIHLGRSEIERGEAQINEAWEISGAGLDGSASVNIHAVVAAHIGRAALCMAREDYRGAIRVAEAGLAIADQTGYLVWGVHRLLPIIAESYLWLREVESARTVGARLRRDAERLGHRLGMALATACDALIVWLAGNSQQGAVMLRDAAEQLEALPFMPDATRIRRQLAGRLAETGDRDAAARELREVHDRLLRLGAEGELQKARAQFREIGIRPPPRRGGQVAGTLSARELEIARLAGARKSSKAIARALGISVRTVDAHLASIYRKLEITSRADLPEAFRRGLLKETE